MAAVRSLEVLAIKNELSTFFHKECVDYVKGKRPCAIASTRIYHKNCDARVIQSHLCFQFWRYCTICKV